MIESLYQLNNTESSRVDSLIPTYLRENAERFIAFMKHYYQFMSRTGAVDTIGILERGEGWLDSTNIATIGGKGYGLTVDILTLNGQISSVIVNNPGIGYEIGDRIYIDDPKAVQPILRYDPDLNEDTDINFDYYGVPYLIVENITASPTSVIERLLKEHDLDEISTEYLDNLQKEIANGVPAPQNIDKRTLFKNIVKYYNTRGSFDSIRTFFKVFFDEDVGVYNTNTAYTYMIQTAISSSEWGQSYKDLVHPAGTKYLISFLLEIIYDGNRGNRNNFFSNALNIPEGSDIIETEAESWMSSLYVIPANHTPTNQIGWLRLILEFLVEALAYTDPNTVLNSEFHRNGINRYFDHCNGLLIKNVSTTEGNNSVGNANRFESVNKALTDANLTRSILFNAPIYLMRTKDFIEDEIIEEIPTGAITNSVINANPTASFFWASDVQYFVSCNSNVDLVVGPLSRVIEAGDTRYYPICYRDTAAAEVLRLKGRYNTIVNDVDIISDIKVVSTVKGKCLSSTRSINGGLGSYTFDIADTDSAYLSEGNAIMSFLMNASVDSSFTVKLYRNGLFDSSILFSSILPYALGSQYFIQFPFWFNEGDHVSFTVVFQPSFLVTTIYDVMIRNGTAFDVYNGTMLESTGSATELIDDKIVMQITDDNIDTIGGYTPDPNDGTACFNIDSIVQLDETVTLRLSDGNELNSFTVVMDDTNVSTPRFISWETTFDDLTKVTALSDEDIYQMADFDETPIFIARGDLVATVDHPHSNLNHRDGNILVTTI